MAQSPQLKQSSPTSPDPQDFRLDATPAMRADNVVSGEHWRIGLITDSLVRFEWSDSGVFENRPTQTVLNRDFGSPVERRVTERDGRVIIDTAALTIVYDQQLFSKEGLSVVVKGVADTQFNTWHYGDAQRGNLKGTARTLDEAARRTRSAPGYPRAPPPKRTCTSSAMATATSRPYATSIA